MLCAAARGVKGKREIFLKIKAIFAENKSSKEMAKKEQNNPYEGGAERQTAALRRRGTVVSLQTPSLLKMTPQD